MELPPLPRSTILLVEVGSRGGGLCAVRRGDVGFDVWWATVLRLDQHLEALQHDERHDRGAVDAHHAAWERTSQQAAG